MPPRQKDGDPSGQAVDMTDTTEIAGMVDAGHFRSVLGHYPTGVCVVTACNAEGERFGLVVGSFTSVSLDPPLVAFFPDKKSSSWPKVRDCGHFCVNVLAEDQLDLCRSFASSGGDKFAGVAFRQSVHNMPLIDGAVAHIECLIENEFDAGDHTIVLGRVQHMRVERDAGPLLFLKGRYGGFAVGQGEA